MYIDDIDEQIQEENYERDIMRWREKEKAADYSKKESEKE